MPHELEIMTTKPPTTQIAAPMYRPDALDRPGRTQRYAALAGLRVLVVDDDLGNREAVGEVLELTGARVELAGSAAEGMTAVDAFMPQVILCDITMPDVDGYTFMRTVRAREVASARARVPALALTALASEQARLEALAAGFQLQLAKPIDIDRLRESVLELAKLIAE